MVNECGRVRFERSRLKTYIPGLTCDICDSYRTVWNDPSPVKQKAQTDSVIVLFKGRLSVVPRDRLTVTYSVFIPCLITPPFRFSLCDSKFEQFDVRGGAGEAKEPVNLLPVYFVVGP
ncbi:hypothetical protein F2P81_014360 [Scophthalmus maximus]|uniref:Uncharacterized protein n=1 Tax=Scophthalmus maximus TaxID=52904 RepID=A0A6A4STD4_SCOMX|nr:hypothetical protein F2P81_014360 [Scophthalmus maximus]